MPRTTTGKKSKGSKRKGAPRKTASPREHLRNLVDELPETELSAAARFLAFLRAQGDPFRHGPDVEAVDEPLSAQEIAGIEEGRREFLEGKAIPWEVARQRLADG